MSDIVKVSVFTTRYSDEESARNNYSAVKNLYDNADSMDNLNAAIVKKDSAGKIEIIIKNEQPTRSESWMGAVLGFFISLLIVILPTSIFPGYISSGGPYLALSIAGAVAIGTIAGAAIGAFFGHLRAGMGRSDLKDLAEVLNANEYGLIVIAIDKMSPYVQDLITSSNKVNHREFETTEKKLKKKIERALKN